MTSATNREIAEQIHYQLSQIVQSSDFQGPDGSQKLKLLFKTLLNEAFPPQGVYLSTHFSRLSFLGAEQGWNGKDKFLVQKYRRYVEGHETSDQDKASQLGVYVIDFLLKALYHLPTCIKSDIDQRQALYSSLQTQTENKEYIAFCKAYVLSYDSQRKLYQITREDEPQSELWLDLQNPEYMEYYRRIEEVLRRDKLYPIIVNLIDADVIDHTVYRPRQIVLQPDFLFNVTSIASCFGGRSIHIMQSLVSRFLDKPKSKALILGNVANHFLDRLLREPEATFLELFRETFEMFPLQYALLSDRELRELYDRAQVHFRTIVLFVTRGLSSLAIRAHHAQIEPTFYSPMYGISGRLDFLGEDPKRPHNPVIVELKSGTPFMPNKHLIGNSHYIQTLLYDLLIRSQTHTRLRARNFILYSGATSDPLRSAPTARQQQSEALLVRNQLYLIELGLQSLDNPEDLKQWLDPSKYRGLFGFLKKDMEELHDHLCALAPLEYDFLREWVAFVSREFHQKKVGYHHDAFRRSDASLWREDIETKQSRYEILSHLQYEQEYIQDGMHMLVMRTNKGLTQKSNFRKGDLVLLYPLTSTQGSPAEQQIFKGTLIEISEESIQLQLRNPQLSERHFQKYELWNIEGDSLDGSYRRMYQGLYEFSKLDADRRALLMGLRPPRFGSRAQFDWPGYLTDRQREVLEGLTAVMDYGLVWGPPGTGKTSVILKNFIHYLHTETTEDILLCGYTNRSVDEICAQLEGLSLNYLRIGARHSVSPLYRDRLLQHQMGSISTRADLVQMLSKCRIVVGTLTSIAGKPELFRLKKFDTVIVDEASQILEPSLIGFLGRFRRSILIGDHKQLPAVTLQDRAGTAYRAKNIEQRGFVNLSDSMFERLYLQSRANNYGADFGLHEQGRMHEDLMRFCNEWFYHGILRSISRKQKMPLENSDTCDSLLESRVAFVDVQGDSDLAFAKSNESEAKRIMEIIQDLIGQNLAVPDEIGVICPFRAQVALIQRKLQSSRISDSDAILVDTVERFQGAAKDVILISLTVQNKTDIDKIISMSSDGSTDRKFNVAITRARERLYVCGNAKALMGHPMYAAFVAEYK